LLPSFLLVSRSSEAHCLWNSLLGLMFNSIQSPFTLLSTLSSRFLQFEES
jgi:hypothetical protein